MAAPSFKLHDVRVVVAEKSAATTTVRPTVAAEGVATVTNPAQAIDGSASSVASLSSATSARLDLSQCDNTRLVTDAGRDWVELNIAGAWTGTPAGDDDVQVEYRGSAADSWTVLDNAAGGAEWTGAARTWTVTAEAADNPEASWEVRVTYTRGTGGSGGFEVSDVSFTIGGDVAAPTTSELAEDVAALAAAKFATAWAALGASVAAALERFGNSDAERAATLNAIRDAKTATEAAAILTASAARYSAAAYEDVATAAAIPRATGV